ncbi:MULTISPECIES: DUF202 domain-containing protein [unclassified Streptomyces]|uniref:DUF202 domain-containing protein n=1 Tax=unclassified Streptomyces TaxID=2593676 RepID=UPI0033B01C5F
MTTARREERDPGLQPERTRLAWRRTTLSCTVAAVFAAKAALRDSGSAAGIVAFAFCCVLWLAFLALAHSRIRTLAAADPSGPATLMPRHATATALCTVAMAAVALVLVF